VLDNRKTKKKIMELGRSSTDISMMSTSGIEHTKINELSMDRIMSEPVEVGETVVRVCVTGGPCGGKTTSLARIAERVQEHGWRVYTVPEAATLLAKGGAMIAIEKFSKAEQIKFQANLMKLQMSLEDIFTDLAVNSGEKSMVLCDRGVMDGSAYIDESLWQALLDEVGWTVVHLRDRRYEQVIHLTTAANGAEKYYNLASNEARYESIEEACRVDSKIQNAWTGHYNFSVIDNNYDNFEDKITRAITTVCKTLDLPAPHTYYLKYLVKSDENRIVPTLPSYVHH
jgi:predicted ATPase